MLKRLTLTTSLLLSSSLLTPSSSTESDPHFSRNATCILQPLSTSSVKGIISFTQSSLNAPVQVASSLRGLIPNNLYTLYIHSSGETTKGEDELGPPFPKQFMQSVDPKGKWDLEVLTGNYRGNNYATTQTNRLTLYGENSIVGRAVAVRHLRKEKGAAGEEERKVMTLEATGIVGLTRDFLTLRPV